MYTQALYPPYFHQATGKIAGKKIQQDKDNRLIGELLYDEDHNMIAHLLVPLLQQLGKQPRWLLWLTPQQKLSKEWLQKVKLPVDKTVQMNHIDPIERFDAMEKALLTGNYSVVIGWLPKITENERIKLRQAAVTGKAYAFIMHRQQNVVTSQGHSCTLKIHFSLYH